jgi:hypothetical protein
MTSKEFEIEIQKLSPDFSVVENNNRPGLSNILYKSRNYDLPVIPTQNIKDEKDKDYRYEFPNGMSARFWSRPEVVARLEDFLKNFESIKENYE